MEMVMDEAPEPVMVDSAVGVNTTDIGMSGIQAPNIAGELYTDCAFCNSYLLLLKKITFLRTCIHVIAIDENSY